MDKIQSIIKELMDAAQMGEGDHQAAPVCCADIYNGLVDLEAALHSVEAEKEPVTQEMIKAGLDAVGPCMGSCGEASPPDGEDVEACYLAMKELDQATTGMQAEKEPEWISCEERLPTEADADFKGNIWAFRPERGVPIMIDPVNVGLFPFTHWMPTGLRRPAPPEHKPE